MSRRHAGAHRRSRGIQLRDTPEGGKRLVELSELLVDLSQLVVDSAASG